MIGKPREGIPATLDGLAKELYSYLRKYRGFTPKGEPQLLSYRLRDTKERIEDFLIHSSNTNKAPGHPGIRCILDALDLTEDGWTAFRIRAERPIRAPQLSIVGLFRDGNKLVQLLVGLRCLFEGSNSNIHELTRQERVAPEHGTWQFWAQQTAKELRVISGTEYTYADFEDAQSPISELIRRFDSMLIEFQRAFPELVDNPPFHELMSLSGYLRTGNAPYPPIEYAETLEGLLQGVWPGYGKEQPWNKDDAEFITGKEAIEMAAGRVSGNELTRLCQPAGPVRYMRKGRRLMVHVVDFQKHLRMLPPAEIYAGVDDYYAEVERRKSEALKRRT